MEFVLIGGWLVCGFVASAIASGKGRSGCLFFILGLLLGPFAVLGAAMMSADGATTQRAGLDRGELRRCPQCAEPIRREASICPNCRSAIDPLPPRTSFAADLVYRIETGIEHVQAWINRGDEEAEAGGRLKSAHRMLLLVGIGVAGVGGLVYLGNAGGVVSADAPAVYSCGKQLEAALADGVLAGMPFDNNLRVRAEAWNALAPAKQTELASAFACTIAEGGDASTVRIVVRDAESDAILLEGNPAGAGMSKGV